MATSSRRELDGFLTSATHSKRCTEQGIEVDSTVLEKLIKQWMGHLQNLMDQFYRQFSALNESVLRVAPEDTIHTTTVDAGGTDEKGVTRVLEEIRKPVPLL
jgi:hypothetical protein